MDWLFRDHGGISKCRDSSVFIAFYHGHGLRCAGCQVLILLSDDSMQRARLLENVSGRSLIWRRQILLQLLCGAGVIWDGE